jgi:hypothetical protein
MEQHRMSYRLNKQRTTSLVEKFYHIGSPNIKFGLLIFKREKGIQKYLYTILHIGPDKFKLARSCFLRSNLGAKFSVNYLQ